MLPTTRTKTTCLVNFVPMLALRLLLNRTNDDSAPSICSVLDEFRTSLQIATSDVAMEQRSSSTPVQVKRYGILEWYVLYHQILYSWVLKRSLEYNSSTETYYTGTRELNATVLEYQV
jgi:hypothetical protein